MLLFITMEFTSTQIHHAIRTAARGREHGRLRVFIFIWRGAPAESKVFHGKCFSIDLLFPPFSSSPFVLLLYVLLFFLSSLHNKQAQMQSICSLLSLKRSPVYEMYLMFPRISTLLEIRVLPEGLSRAICF